MGKELLLHALFVSVLDAKNVTNTNHTDIFPNQ